jgi:hypothetical protein
MVVFNSLLNMMHALSETRSYFLNPVSDLSSASCLFPAAQEAEVQVAHTILQ